MDEDKIKIQTALIEKVSELIDGGKSQEAVFAFLAEDCAIIDAIMVLRSAYKISLREAKERVSSSPYWAAEQQVNAALHEAGEMIGASKSENYINVIFPYRYAGLWVFDDEGVGLLQEPFVGGADTMIDLITADIPNAAEGFGLIFSDDEFPGADICLEWRRTDGSGNWYYSSLLDREGWLCPALLKYFTDAPKNIFVKIKAA